MRLLLHTCCAPCSVFCIDTLKKENIDITSYWYNPNIHPYKEYEARLNCLKEYNESINLPLIVDDYYGLREFCKNTVSNLDARCTYCYKVRLEKTARYAKENGFDAFSTTLLYSIYQNHELIKKICEKLEKEYDIKFLYRDFRTGFWLGQEKAKEIGLYMQKYCGCIFSEEERYKDLAKNAPKLPDNFIFLPVSRNIVIKKEKDNKEQYLDLLLETDSEKEIIEKYLKDGELFVLTYKEEVVCVAVVSKIDEDTVELKKIITKKEYRRQGYGKKMLKYLTDNYKQKYEKMIVGTKEDSIPFYVKQGFDKYEKTLFLESIFLYYYSKSFKITN